MKKVLFPLIALVLVLGLALPMAMPAGANPGPGLVALWHLDEGTGTTASDSSGNGNDGTINEATYVSGMFDQALSFDGTDDYVDFGTGVSSLIAGDYTVEAWVKPSSLSPGRNVAVSFSYMELGHNAGKVYFWQAYNNSWGKGYKYVSSSVLLDINNFSHIVGVFHKDVGIDLYVDGNYIGSDTTKTGTSPNIFGKTYAGVWYQMPPIGPGGGWFNGTIDEVRIWDEALSAEQVFQSYIAPVVTTEITSGNATVNVGAEESWNITINIYGGPVDVEDVVVQDGMGADLDDIVVGTPTQGTASGAKKGRGRMGATMVTWDVGNLTAGESATLVVTVTTGFNNPQSPKQEPKHEFTSIEDDHELDGGASATYWYGDPLMEYETPETVPLTVDVVEPAP